MLDDVEAVEDELGAGEQGADGVDVACEHVEADDADGAAAPRPRLRKNCPRVSRERPSPAHTKRWRSRS